MSARKIRAGEAYVEATVKDATRAGLESVRANLRTFATRTLVAGGAVFGFGAGIAAAFVPAIQAAGDFRETVNKFDATFGDQADAARAFSADLAESIGRDQADLMNGMSAFQAMMRGLSFEPAQAREMSQELQALALDFASFHNLADDEANWRFLSALSGSVEVMDQFGVNLKQAAIEEELLAMGIAKSVQQASEQEKTLARLNLIRKAMSQQGAIGDAFKTRDDYTNVLKRIQAEFSKTLRAVGEALMPFVEPLLQGVTVVARIVSQLAQKFPGLTVGVAAFAVALMAIGGALITVATFAYIASFAITGLIAAMGFATTLFAVVFSPVGAIAAAVLALGVGLGALGYYLLNNTETGKKWSREMGEAADHVRERYQETFDAIAHALTEGEFVDAWGIWSATVVGEWGKALGWLGERWFGFRDLFMRVLDQLVAYYEVKMLEIVGATDMALMTASGGLLSVGVDTDAARDEIYRRLAARRAEREEERKAWENFTSGLEIASGKFREGFISEDRNQAQMRELIVDMGAGVDASLLGPQTGTISSFVAQSIGRALGGGVEQTAEDKMAGELAKHTTLLEEIRDKPPAAFTGGT